MRFLLLLVSIIAPIALAATIIPREGPVKVIYNEMQDIIDSGDPGKCLPIAVIFARGTFDSENVGYWVGPDFLEAFPADKVARQGVNDYPATLEEYLEGGSASGAQALVDMVNAYLKLCPGSKIIISGWSQGALVAHMGLDALESETINNNVAALITFGSPIHLFTNNLQMKIRPDHFHHPCIPGDLLCDPEKWSTLSVLRDVKTFIEKSGKELLNGGLHIQRYEEIKALTNKFLKQAEENREAMSEEVHRGHMRKLALDFVHFLYGHLGYGRTAAEWAMKLPDIKALL